MAHTKLIESKYLNYITNRKFKEVCYNKEQEYKLNYVQILTLPIIAFGFWVSSDLKYLHE